MKSAGDLGCKLEMLLLVNSWETTAGRLRGKPREEKRTGGQPGGTADVAPRVNTKGKDITICFQGQICLNLRSKITP